MKVIHLSFSAGGGAGIAASRSVQALRAAGVDAELWSTDGGPSARRLYPHWWRWLKMRLDSFGLRFNRRKRLFSAWSNNTLPSRLAAVINRENPDLVHLHWVGAGFLNFDELRSIHAPIVWTLHDPWALTGGCHYPGDCLRFTDGCGMCPQLGSARESDLSRRNHRRRRAAIHNVALWIAPSEWIGRLATEKGGLPCDRVKVVPNGLDIRRFSQGSHEAARQALGVDGRTIVVVAGAHDLREPRKGGQFLAGALTKLKMRTERALLLVLIGEGSRDLSQSWPCDVRFTGFLKGDTDLARILRAADFMLLPSLQDNLPNTAVEALVCGCAVVGFDRGGIREIVEHGRTGWLTEDASADGLGQAAADWLERRPERDAVATAASRRVETEFASQVHAQRLLEAYGQVLKKPGAGGLSRAGVAE